MTARTPVRPTFANPASAIHLGLVGAAVAVATAVTLFATDPGFVWVLPALCAFPLFLFVTLAEGAIRGESLVLATIVEASRGRLRRRASCDGRGRAD
ncbi:SCO4225 family membrane protein [Streptomyces avidinii]|uniref:SCO4225 family membrane protein n=1 Tax=Streptomyces avidinii TaxID=1895 RepID=UPI0037A046A6